MEMKNFKKTPDDDTYTVEVNGVKLWFSSKSETYAKAIAQGLTPKPA